MQNLQTDIVQSFWLRFWREPHQGQLREWRGTIWHEQQGLDEKPTAVANPDEAFEFVRRALRPSRPADDEPVPMQMQMQQANTAPQAPVARGWSLSSIRQRLAAFWRKEPGP